MVESMACGTPVVATRQGAVPEVIEDGRSGVIVDSPDQMAEAIDRAVKLDPAECRASAIERFSPERMVADYLTAYERLLAVSGRRTRNDPETIPRGGTTGL
jgi:glycosyltransferase involved in cell wall biosynthesis